jgi:hypothetical protein
MEPVAELEAHDQVADDALPDRPAAAVDGATAVGASAESSIRPRAASMRISGLSRFLYVSWNDFAITTPSSSVTKAPGKGMP